MMLLLLFGSFFLLLALGVPILFSMGVSAGVYYVVSGYPLMQFVQKTIGGVDSFTLLAIPFFLLAGDIMGKGGISKRMLRFANALVGPLTGGLAVTGVVSSAMFGTICGSAPATAASIGSIVAPDMEARGYSKRFTGSIIAASGLLGIIIPPQHRHGQLWRYCRRVHRQPVHRRHYPRHHGHAGPGHLLCVAEQKVWLWPGGRPQAAL